MSSNYPPAGPGQPEFLDSGHGAPVPQFPGGPAPRGRGRKIGLIGGGVVGGAVLIGGGVWAAMSFLGQGAQPAEALPEDTIGYVSIDLDPSGKQKIEAIETLRKFPAFKDGVDLDTDDDIRERIFEEIQGSGACKDLDFEDDVKPWLGDRAAMAAVDQGGDTPIPAFVVQVKGEDKADEGLKKLMDCESGDDTDTQDDNDESSDEAGWAFTGDWVVLTEKQEQADEIVEDVKDGSLADDKDYKRWTEEVGDPGVVNLYAAPEAGEFLAELVDDMGGLSSANPLSPRSDDGFGDNDGDFNEDFSTDDDVPTPVPSAEAPTSPDDLSEFEEQLEELETDQSSFQPASLATTDEIDPDDDTTDGPSPDGSDEATEEMTEALKDFKGMAGTVRFNDGAVEIEFAGEVISGQYADVIATTAGDDVLATLPDDTAIAFGMGLKEDWFTAIVEQIATYSGGGSVDDLIAEAEAESGLELPEDAEALAGESLAVAIDGSVDFDEFSNSEDITGLPVGVKIKGDADDIEAALDKIRPQLGPDGDKLVTKEDGDYVSVGVSDDYLDTLSEDGKLGDNDTFKDVVPNAEEANSILYANFDAGDDWLVDTVEALVGGNDEVIENIEPLEALGFSSWQDDDVSHSLIKITTD